MNPSSIYTTGGTVQAGGGIYLPRQADDELLQLCREGQFAYVLTPRQMGKSSLMVRTAQRLEAEGVTSVVIDLTKIGTEVTAEQWYLGLLTEIDDALMLDTDIFDWWAERQHLGVTQRLTRFFEEVLLKEVAGQLVVFVDEIDTTLSLSFTDDFFIAIRYFYVGRAKAAALGRLSFVLIGVATPGDLIRDRRRTPFNIGTRVNLVDFTPSEAKPFSAGLSGLGAAPETVLSWVMDWTGGHPFLTQRLCEVVQSKGQGSESKNQLTKQDVDNVAKSIFLATSAQKEETNLKFVGDMLVGERTPDREGVVRTYGEVWKGRRVLDEEQSMIKSHLKLAGVVRREPETGLLRVRNEIYRRVFDGRWVRKNLPEKDWQRRIREAAPVIIPLAAALAAAVPLGGLAEYRRREAVEQRAEAQKQTKLAQENERLAEENAREAQRQAEFAKQQALLSQESAEAAKLSEGEARKQEQLAQENEAEAEAQKANAEKQAQLAQMQKTAAKEHQAAAEKATKQADIARIAEVAQRSSAEQSAREAKQQAKLAQQQTILAQVNAARTFLWADQPLEGIVR